MATLQCANDFSVALFEVDSLLDHAEENQHTPKKYSLFCKSAILLLSAKFEAFLENAISEYCFLLSGMKLSPEKLPKTLKFSALNYLLSDKAVDSLRLHKDDFIEILNGLHNYCRTGTPLDKIVIDSRFDYGKHGSKMICKLLQRIGIEDVWASCVVEEESETLLSSETNKQIVDVEGEINAITNLRNNIIHNDATPSITHQQIATYKKHIIQFSVQLDIMLIRQMADIK